MPVVPGSARADEIEATLKNSVLWNHVERLHLLKNMRVHLTGDEEAENFAKVLEDIGGGILGYETEGVIAPPESVCVKDSNELIDKVFPNLAENHINPPKGDVREALPGAGGGPWGPPHFFLLWSQKKVKNHVST